MLYFYDILFHFQVANYFNQFVEMDLIDFNFMIANLFVKHFSYFHYSRSLYSNRNFTVVPSFHMVP